MTENRAQHGTDLCIGGSNMLDKYKVKQIQALLS